MKNNASAISNTKFQWPVYFLTGLAIVIMVVSGYAQIADQELLEYLVLEDGILENLTALLLFCLLYTSDAADE